jgi:hypothetical protein
MLCNRDKMPDRMEHGGWLALKRLGTLRFE